MKKIKMDQENDGFPVTSVREIILLRELDHPNVVKLREVVVGFRSDTIFLSFDCYPTDLAQLIDSLHNRRLELTLSDIKTLMIEMLLGVEYLHRHSVLHR